MRRTISMFALTGILALGAGPVLAQSATGTGSAAGNGTSTPAGPAGRSAAEEQGGMSKNGMKAEPAAPSSGTATGTGSSAGTATGGPSGGNPSRN